MRSSVARVGMVGALVALACSSPRTGLIVRLDSEVPWGAGATVQSVVLEVRRGGPAGPQRSLRATPLGDGPGRGALPMFVGVWEGGDDLDTPIWVEALGCASPNGCARETAVVSQRALVRFSREETLELPLLLASACVGARCTTSERCEPATGMCLPASSATPLPFQGTDAGPRLDAPAADAPLETRDVPDASAIDVVSDGPADVPLDTPRDLGPSDVPFDLPRDVPIDQPVDTGPADVPVDVARDIGADTASACAAGQTLCAGACRDLQTNLAHCGACGRACAASGMCRAGRCYAQASCASAVAGCGLVIVPGGTFAMGDPDPMYSAHPVVASVTVGTVIVDRFEVTVARFRSFWSAGHPTPTTETTYPTGAIPFEGAVREPTTGTSFNWLQSGRDAHPINGVDWATAQAFCVWDGGRLPTQAEWEFIARGMSGQPFPWRSGDAPGDRACWSAGSAGERVGTCSVLDFPGGATPEGVEGLAGNVYEWNADWFSAHGGSYWTTASRTNPLCTDRASGQRVARGGSWGNADARYLRSAGRLSAAPTSTNYSLGFRCVRSP